LIRAIRVISVLFLALPIVITFWIIYWIYLTLRLYLLDPIARFIQYLRSTGTLQSPPQWWDHYVAPVVALLLVLIFLYLLGLLVQSRLSRLIDAMFAFPVILLAITIVSIVGRNVVTIVGVLGLTGWGIYARTVRSSVLSLRERDFVTAARCVGAGHGRILLRHVLPSTVAPILVVATVQVATMIVLESGLSFFGLGIQPPTPTWGGMLAEGRDYLSNAWWVSTMPGLAIMLTVVGINLLGDGLRDVFDPQLKDY